MVKTKNQEAFSQMYLAKALACFRYLLGHFPK